MTLPSHRPASPPGGHRRRLGRRSGAAVALAAVGLAAVGAVPLLSHDAGAETKSVAAGALADVPGLGGSAAPRPEAPTTALLAAVPAPATNYPVPAGAVVAAPTGAGTRCTLAAPCSLPTAVRRTPAGGTVVLRGGTYRSGEIGVRTRITVQPYPRERVWVSGTVPVTGWVRDGARWRHDGWKACFPSTMVPEAIDPEYPLSGRGDQVFVDGRGLRQVAGAAAVTAGTFAVDCAADRIYVGSDPAGHQVEATALDFGFRMWKAEPAGTVIRGLGFAGFATQGVIAGAPRVTLEDNVFTANGVSGAWLAGSEDSVVRGNVFTRNGRRGLAAGEAGGLLAERNVFSSNNTKGARLAWDAGGFKVIRTDRMVFRSNLVEGNFSTGLWMDISVTNATVVGNVARNNTAIGIFAELSDRMTIASNISQGNGVGVMAADSSRISVVNNTLFNNKIAVLVKDGSRKNADAAEVRQGVTWEAYSNVVQNNLLVGSDNAQVSISKCGSGPRMVSVLDANGYQPLPGKPGPAAVWSDGAGKCGAKYATVAALRAAAGVEKAGLDLDPAAKLFVDQGRGDFRLRPGSPALGRGLPLPAGIAALLGKPAGVKVDLGALGSAATGPRPSTSPSVSASPSASVSPTKSGPPPVSTALPRPEAGGWGRNGSATLLTTGPVAQRGIQLTTAQRDRAGSMIWPAPVMPSLRASFDLTLGGGTAADGVALVLLDPAEKPTALGDGGGGLGFRGLKGTAVVFDTYRNEWDSRVGFVGVTTGKAGSTAYRAVSAENPELRGTTRHITVSVRGGTVTVTVDGAQVLKTTVTLPDRVLVGFTGATGGKTDQQRVTNVDIRTAD